jgi:hypothetical protein
MNVVHRQVGMPSDLSGAKHGSVRALHSRLRARSVHPQLNRPAAEAEIATRQSALEFAKADFERGEDLIKTGTIT